MSFVVKNQNLCMKAIGTFHCEERYPYDAARQGALSDNAGEVRLEKAFAQGLRDLEGFSHIWLIFVFDRNASPGAESGNPKQFAHKAKLSPVLAKKGKEIQRIIKNISFDMNDEFWEFVAQSDENSRRSALIERAKTNAVREKEQKVPIRGGFERTKK